MQCLQDPSQSKVDNLNNVRREVSRHFRNKKKENLKTKMDGLETNSKIKKIPETCLGTSMILRRVTSLELIQYRMRRVIRLQTPTLFWLGGENISLSCSVYVGLMMSGRQKYTQQNH